MLWFGNIRSKAANKFSEGKNDSLIFNNFFKECNSQFLDMVQEEELRD